MTGYKQNYLLLPGYRLLAENLILVLVYMKGQKRDKSEFINKSVGIIVKDAMNVYFC